MESLTFYVSREQNLLFAKKEELEDEHPFVFPEQLLGHPCHHKEWITNLIVEGSPVYHNGDTNIITHSSAFNEVLQNKKAMNAEIRSKLTPVQKNFCETKYAEEKRNNKARIDELRDELAIKNEFDL